MLCSVHGIGIKLSVIGSDFTPIWIIKLLPPFFFDVALSLMREPGGKWSSKLAHSFMFVLNCSETYSLTLSNMKVYRTKPIAMLFSSPPIS